MIYYKDTEYLKRTISKNCLEISRSQKMIEDAKSELVSIGTKLLKQFSAFAKSNKNLYDSDFVEFLSERNLEILSVRVENPKCAYRIEVKNEDKEIRFVMVPYLFITDVDQYVTVRKRKLKFGEKATVHDVEKHYDGEISRLMKEVEKLKAEKTSLTTNDHLWR